MRVGDGAVVHAGAGLEVGYDSNVFYSATGPLGAAMLIALPYVELTNAPPIGGPSPSTYYTLSATLQYRQYLSSVASDKASGFSPTANAFVEFGSNQQLSFSIGNSFIRSLEAPYVAADADVAASGKVNEPIKHWADLLTLRLKWAPGGGRLVGVLQNTTAFDFYEKDASSPIGYNKANSIGDQLALDVSWKWLPKTALYGRATQAYNHYLDSNAKKNDSLPLHVLVGVRGLLTAKLGINVAVGYANGFYLGGGSGPSGVRGNLAGLAELNWSLQETTGFVLGYRHDFENSLIGNFYYADSIYASLHQLLAQRVIVAMGAKMDWRTYQGLGVGVETGGASRSDRVVQAGGSVDYYVQTSFYVGAGASYSYNRTTSASSAPDPQSAAAAAPLDYDKYQVMARLGVTY